MSYLFGFPDMEITWLCPALRAGYFESGGLLLHRFFSLLVSFQHEACQPNQYRTLREIDEADSDYRTMFYVFAALLTKRFNFECFSPPERPESLITEEQPWPSAFIQPCLRPQTAKLEAPLSYINCIIKFWLKFWPCAQYDMNLMQTWCKKSFFMK